MIRFDKENSKENSKNEEITTFFSHLKSQSLVLIIFLWNRGSIMIVDVGVHNKQIRGVDSTFVYSQLFQ